MSEPVINNMHSTWLYMTSVTHICINVTLSFFQHFSSREAWALCQQIRRAFPWEMVSGEGKAKDKSFHLGKWVLNCIVFDLEQGTSVVRKGHLKCLSLRKYYTQNQQESISVISKWKRKINIQINILGSFFFPISQHCFLWWCLLFVITEMDTLGMLTIIVLVSV